MKARRSVYGLALALVFIFSACNETEGSQGERPSPTSDSATEQPTAGTESADESLDPVKIGVVSQERELIQLPEVSYTARAYEEYINAERGGVDGHPLVIDVCLSGDTPESTQACIQRFINDPEILAVVHGSADTVTAWRMTAPAGLPILVFFVDSLDAQTEHVYSLDAGALGQALAVGKYLAENLGAGSASLACIDDPNFAVICDGTAAGIEQNGVTVHKKVLIDPGAGDYTGPVIAMEPEQADAIVAVMPGDQCLPLARAIQQLGVSQPVVSIDICLSQNVVESGLVEGWTAVMNTVIVESPDAGDPDVIELHRILSQYGIGTPTFTGNVGLMYAQFEMLHRIFLDLGVDNLSREAVDSAISTFSGTLPTYGPVSCPGPGKWVGVCHPSSIMMQIQDEQFVRASDFIDVTALLEQSE